MEVGVFFDEIKARIGAFIFTWNASDYLQNNKVVAPGKKLYYEPANKKSRLNL